MDTTRSQKTKEHVGIVQRVTITKKAESRKFSAIGVDSTDNNIFIDRLYVPHTLIIATTHNRAWSGMHSIMYLFTGTGQLPANARQEMDYICYQTQRMKITRRNNEKCPNSSSAESVFAILPLMSELHYDACSLHAFLVGPRHKETKLSSLSADM